MARTATVIVTRPWRSTRYRDDEHAAHQQVEEMRPARAKAVLRRRPYGAIFTETSGIERSWSRSGAGSG